MKRRLFLPLLALVLPLLLRPAAADSRGPAEAGGRKEKSKPRKKQAEYALLFGTVFDESGRSR